MPSLLLRLHDKVSACVTPPRCLLAALILFALMVAVGAVPGKAQALSAAVYDKLLHFAAYALLSGLVYGALSGRPAVRALRTLVVVGALGALDEAIQGLMPYRDANWMDWNFDMMAALTCVALLIMLHPLYSLLTSRTIEPETGIASAAQPDLPE